MPRNDQRPTTANYVQDMASGATFTKGEIRAADRAEARGISQAQLTADPPDSSNKAGWDR